jgi:hypothetical protein
MLMSLAIRRRRSEPQAADTIIARFREHRRDRTRSEVRHVSSPEDGRRALKGGSPC